MPSKLLAHAPKLTSRLLQEPAKRIVVSGPNGFLGRRVVDSLVEVQALRREAGIDPGEVILMSSSPGRLMERLSRRYNAETLSGMRASRIDYLHQHDVAEWTDHLGSLRVEGENSVFINLAALASAISGSFRAIHAVNYSAAVAAADACEKLGVGHFIQASTQATNAERAGQVPYSQSKAMADFHLSRLDMPVTIACTGLLYDKTDASVGQQLDRVKLNMIDFSVLPFTPIIGTGRAPMQPQEITDTALRFAYLALTDPHNRPEQDYAHYDKNDYYRLRPNKDCRVYDAVGPDTLSVEDMLERFAHYQGNHNFVPVYIDYRNVENILSIKSMGNLSRQFISLLRSEQSGITKPIIGDPQVWNALLGDELPLTRLENAFKKPVTRYFPLLRLVRIILENPRLIPPGTAFTLEVMACLLKQGCITRKLFAWKSPSIQEQANIFFKRFPDISEVDLTKTQEDFKKFDTRGKGELLEHEAMELIEWTAKHESKVPRQESKVRKTFQELRVKVEEIDEDKNGKLSFIEWACVVHDKKWAK